MIYIFVFPFFLATILLYYHFMRWIYRKFVKSRIQSKIKRIAIVFAMIILFFSESIITHIIAYYYIYTIPIPNVSKIELEINGYGANQLDKRYSRLFGGFTIADNMYLSKNGEIISLDRVVVRNFPYILLLMANDYIVDGRVMMLKKKMI